MKRQKKAFDCVQMKRRIQEKVYEETKDMTPQERIAYLRRRVEEGPFAQLWREGLARQAEKQASAARG